MRVKNSNNMDAREYYEEQRKLGYTYNITSNPSPNYFLSFYQDIFTLMEEYHQAKSKEEAEERYETAKKEYKEMPGRYMTWLYDDEVLQCIKLAAFGKDES